MTGGHLSQVPVVVAGQRGICPTPPVPLRFRAGKVDVARSIIKKEKKRSRISNDEFEQLVNYLTIRIQRRSISRQSFPGGTTIRRPPRSSPRCVLARDPILISDDRALEPDGARPSRFGLVRCIFVEFYCHALNDRSAGAVTSTPRFQRV